MALIEALVLDGTVTLIALAILGLEIVCLLIGVRTAPARWLVIANGLSGVFLILALRSAVLDQGALSIALWLSLGFIAHVIDLIVRLRR